MIVSIFVIVAMDLINTYLLLQLLPETLYLRNVTRHGNSKEWFVGFVFSEVAQ